MHILQMELDFGVPGALNTPSTRVENTRKRVSKNVQTNIGNYLHDLPSGRIIDVPSKNIKYNEEGKIGEIIIFLKEKSGKKIATFHVYPSYTIKTENNQRTGDDLTYKSIQTLRYKITKTGPLFGGNKYASKTGDIMSFGYFHYILSRGDSDNMHMQIKNIIKHFEGETES